jgi:hypothetical protein
MKTAFFAPRTLNQLPGDNTEALSALCTEFERLDGHARQLPEHHDDYVEALGILRAFAIARDASLKPFPELGAQRHQNIASVVQYFSDLRQAVRAELTTRHSQGFFEAKTQDYLSLFSRTTAYEFDDEQHGRIAALLDQLREWIAASSLVNEEHRRRLLRRLEATRAELHRKTAEIDRFWGFLGEAAIVMRKYGEDARPMSDRVLELGRLVLGSIFASEGIKALPELSQLLAPGVQKE